MRLASLSLEFSGRASTPGALVTVASGKGELKLGDVTMHAPTPLAVVATSDAVLSGDAGGSGEQLTAALRTQIDASAVAVGPRTIPIEIADGAAKLALVTLESEAGTTKVETTVDLASLVVDSAWLAEPKAPDVPQAERPRGGALPSVGVVYTGPLGNAWALESRITAEPLERELAIRKMELDADQLERLHKADAERARRDDERRRALESDQGSVAPAPASSGARAVPPPRCRAAPVPIVPQSSASSAVPFDPAGAPAAAAAPAIPPSSASAPGVIVPPAPGEAAQSAVPGTSTTSAPFRRKRAASRRPGRTATIVRAVRNGRSRCASKCCAICRTPTDDGLSRCAASARGRASSVCGNSRGSTRARRSTGRRRRASRRCVATRPDSVLFSSDAACCRASQNCASIEMEVR